MKTPSPVLADRADLRRSLVWKLNAIEVKIARKHKLNKNTISQDTASRLRGVEALMDSRLRLSAQLRDVEQQIRACA